MQPVDCPFCGHANPEGAKFCNECGSPLYLAPCKECEAVNHVNDTTCYRCGARLAPHGATPPVGEADPGDRTVERLEQQADWVEDELHRFGEEASAAALESAGVERPESEPHGVIDAIEHDLGAVAPVPAELPTVRQVAPRPKPAAPVSVPRTLDRAYGRPRGVGDFGLGTGRPWFISDFADERRGRWREVVAGAFGVALAAAIVAGGYRYFAEQLSPSPPVERGKRVVDESPATSVMAPEKNPGTSTAGPLLVSAPDPKSPETEGESKPVPAVPSPAPEPTRATTARAENETAAAAARDSLSIAASEPRCPPAVEALALCEWFTHADRK